MKLEDLNKGIEDLAKAFEKKADQLRKGWKPKCSGCKHWSSANGEYGQCLEIRKSADFTVSLEIYDDQGKPMTDIHLVKIRSVDTPADFACVLHDPKK